MTGETSGHVERRVELLRGINVGGRNKVAMADLRAFAEALDLRNPKTLLQSGNLVFDDPNQYGPAELEDLLEMEAARRLGLEVDFIVRTPIEWEATIAANPFPGVAASGPSHLLVTFLKGDPPDEEAAHDLRNSIAGTELVAILGRELFISFPDGIGRSKLTNALVEKKLRRRGTALQLEYGRQDCRDTGRCSFSKSAMIAAFIGGDYLLGDAGVAQWQSSSFPS